MEKSPMKVLMFFCLATAIMESCSNSNRTNNIEMNENDILYEDSISLNAYSQESLDSNKTIIGKWIVFESPWTSLFVIYEEDGRYYADNINNGVWSNDPYELVKTRINGNLGFKPVIVDEWSETYEIRDNGVYAKNIDGTGGQLFYNAEGEAKESISEEYDPVVNSYKCYSTGDQIVFYSNNTGLFVSNEGGAHDFIWSRRDKIVTISYPGLGSDCMTFDEKEGTLSLKTRRYGTMIFEQ